MHSIITILPFFLALTMAQSPSLGDPTLLGSYPSCAAQCNFEVINGLSNPCASNPANNLTCLCDSAIRAATAGCQTVSCSPAEFTTTQTLSQQVCGPLYSNGTLSASRVTAAIASATAAAAAAVSGKDTTNSNDWPPCAAACQMQNIPSSGCGTLANASCVCSNGPLNAALGACEQNSCSPADLQTIVWLSFAYCKSVGGTGNASDIANQTVATQTAGIVPVGPTGSLTPFTGGAGLSGVEKGSWMVLAAAFGGALGMLL